MTLMIHEEKILKCFCCLQHTKTSYYHGHSIPSGFFLNCAIFFFNCNNLRILKKTEKYTVKMSTLSIRKKFKSWYEYLLNKCTIPFVMLEFLTVNLPTIIFVGVLFFLVNLPTCVTILRKRFSRCHKTLERFNGPPAFPVIGTVRDMIFSDFWTWSNEMCRKWGDPLRLWRFGHPMVFISTYEYASQLLSKSQFNGKLKDLDMIYRVPGAHLHTQRRIKLSHAFSNEIVERSIVVLCDETIKLTQTLEKYANTGEEFNMIDCTMKCIVQMLFRCDFGDAIACDEITTQKYMNALCTFANNMRKRMFSTYPWLKSDSIYFYLCEEGRELKKAGDVLNEFANEAIRSRRTRQNQNRSSPPQSTPRYLDLLLNLVDLGQLTDDDVISELNSFIGTSYDTTTLAICWTLLLLALNPNCQQRVYEEVDSLLHSSISTSTPTDAKGMQYLELCLMESLRLFPPVPIFPQSASTDITLDDGRIIPADTDVLIFANLIHRDPKHFPDPTKFIPERHVEPNPALMPFSFGIRDCIDQVYGMYLSKVVLAYLCKEYFWETDIKSADNVKIKYQGLMYPAEELKFRIKKRMA